MNWTNDYENILESLRLNSVYMSRSHKKKYFAFKRMSNWFRVPTIVLSAFASVIAVGSEPYLKQQNISGITCLVSMIVGILNSIELYLKLQEAIESELDKSKQWYALAAEIYKVTGLEAVHRDDDPAKLLNGFYDKYMELFHESSLNGIHYGDQTAKCSKQNLRWIWCLLLCRQFIIIDK
jgi:hypothetical protein